MATNRKWLVVSPCSFFRPPDLRVPCVYLLLDCCRHTVRAPLPFEYIFSLVANVLALMSIRSTHVNIVGYLTLGP